MNRPFTIYTFGDSHAHYPWYKIPGVKIRNFGPKTMYRVGRDQEIMVKDVPKEAVAVFCFGEVDCRCHIHKHQPWQEAVSEVVSKFLRMVLENAEYHRPILIFNVPPPPRKTDATESKEYPFLGTDEERLSYVNHMNRMLRNNKRFTFIDVYKDYADHEGYLRMDLSDGHVHINDPEFLWRWLRTNEIGGA